MTDIERARLIAAPYVKYDPEETLLGWHDGEGAVHSTLAAIQSEREQAKVLVEALRKIAFARPVGDINQAKGVRGLVIRMEAEALVALGPYGDGHE